MNTKMDVVQVPLASLKLREKNTRIHAEKQLHEFERSIKMFGQIRPIVIDEDNEILAGNGLYLALKRLNYEMADCYIISNLTEAQKKKLMIADNKIFSLGIDNLAVLEEFINELVGDLDIPGFDPDILATMTEDVEDVTRRICDYGVLNDEDISVFERSAKSDETAKVANAPSQPFNQSHSDEHESTEVSSYVVCPRCGEKIWL
ncbi:MAG: ParB/Srx family N-terminal domain-containing protein [Clostridia bacterium]|nr:ParB/Srx family N-terminal domain-containing protein [Clostridia bacterium]